jgi:dienelactone hydrolase
MTQTRRMEIVLFHSMYGLRPVEMAAAGRLRAHGHHVVLPDLFEGRTAPGDVGSGLALMDRIGWPTIVATARATLDGVGDEAALIGFSMGVGVIAEVWPDRLGAAAVACLHAPAVVPPGVRRGTPVQLHVATPDRFAPPDQVLAFETSAARTGALPSLRRYPGAGHYFTDPSLDDYDAAAEADVWTHLLGMLGRPR